MYRRKFKREWLTDHHWPNRCTNCNKKVRRYKDRFMASDMLTLDHVIPKTILIELELYELWFDYDNFVLMCQKCNTRKGAKLPSVEELTPQLLYKFEKAIERRNLTIKT